MGQVKCEDGVSTRQHCKQHIYIYEFSCYCVSTRQRRCYRNFKTSGNQCIAMKPKILFGNSWNGHIFPFLMNIPFMKYNLRVVHPYLSRPTLTSTFQLYHEPIMLKSLFLSGQSCATLICSCRKNVRSPSTHRAHQWNIRKSNFVQNSGHESSSREKRVLRNFGPVLCSVQCVCINKPSNMDWCSEETSVRTKIMVTIK